MHQNWSICPVQIFGKTPPKSFNFKPENEEKNEEGCCVENAWFLNNSHKSSNGSGDEVTSEIIIII